MDFAADCLEEIALEGLDGITLNALWLRLENREPEFSLPLDDNTCKFIWENVIVPETDVVFYELPIARKELQLFNRFEYTDKVTGLVLEQEPVEDIYPLQIVDDLENGIRGSCSTYKTRTNITHSIRSADNSMLLSYKEVMERFGDHLVIVASQQTRYNAIIGEEKAGMGSKLPARTYVLLERVARSRWHGEVTHGANSLKVIDDNPKTLFYIRKKLVQMGLVKSQLFNSRLRTQQNTGGTLIHLKRFFVQHQKMYIAWTEKMCKYLETRPGKMEELHLVREALNVPATRFKRLMGYSQMNQFVLVQNLKYREVYPDAEPTDYLSVNGSERQVRVIKLHRTFKGEDSLDDELNSDEEDSEGEQLVQIVYEKSLLQQVYEYCVKHAGTGISQAEIKKAFSLTQLESRMVTRYMERENLCKKVLHDQGRQRVAKYVATKCLADCDMIQNMEKERLRIQMFHPARNSPLKQEKEDPDGDATGFGAGGDEQQLEDSIRLDTSVADDMVNMSTINFSYEDYDHHKKEDAHITVRWLRRANVILEHLKDVQIIDNYFILKKKIVEMEGSEEEIGLVDKKSVMRIVNRLQKSGQLKVMKTKLNISDTEHKEIVLICHIDVKESDSVVRTFIESEEQKGRALSRMQREELVRKEQARAKKQLDESVNELTEDNDGFDSVPRDPAKLNYALLTSKMMTKDMQYDPCAGKRYGYKPKCRRMELLHKYLWYLVYGYNLPDSSDLSQMELNIHSTEESVSTIEDPIPDSVLSTFKVYCDEMTWKRFVPPLPKHKGYCTGWYLTGDILLVMPLSIFVSLTRVNFNIPGLMHILKDPVRRHVTVSQLPSPIRQAIMVCRKYLFSISEVMVQHCMVGLLSFAGRQNREKHQVYAFLHKQASYVDTTLNDKDNRQTHVTTLDSYQAVCNFWFALHYTAINTKISCIVEPRGKVMSLEFQKKFKEVLASKTPQTIPDIGSIPGDQEGACGFDTSLFFHLKRNWYWNYDHDVKMCAMLDTVNRITEERGRGTRTKRQEVGGIPLVMHKKCLSVTNIKLGKTTGDKDEVNTAEIRSKLKSSRRKTSRRKDSESPMKDHTRTKPQYERILVSGDDAIPHKGGKGIKRKAKTRAEQSPKERPAKKVKREDTIVRTKQFVLDDRGKTVSLKGYDRKDTVILEKRDRERVDWADEEDSLLLMMEVTQRFLLYPNRRRDTLVSYFCMRDILHKESDKFHTKTSKAIQRRLKYIMKNTQTDINIEVFVGQAMQDKELLQRFKKDGKIYNHSMDVVELEKVFKEAYQTLKNKFSSPDQQYKGVTLPDTLEELHRRYDVESTASVHKSRFIEVTSNNDVCFWVLHNVIHCAMLLHNKSGRAHELFQLFNQYPEELLMAVFNTMKVDGLITKLKELKSKGAKTMPWNKISVGNPGLGGYQVTQRYMYHWFAKQYPQAVFENAHTYLCKFFADGEQSGVQLSMEEKGGFAAVTVGLMAKRQIKFEVVIPEQIITMQSRKKPPSADVKRAAAKAQQQLPQPLNSDDEDDDAIIEEAEKNRRLKGQQEESKKLEESQPVIAETVSHIAFQDGTLKSTPSTSRTFLNFMHTTYYGYSNVHGYSPEHNLIVNGCHIKIQLKDDLVDSNLPVVTTALSQMTLKLVHAYNTAHTLLHPDTGCEMMKYIRFTYPSGVDLQDVIQDCRDLYDYSDEDVCELQELCDFIKAPGSLGITHAQLMEKGAHMKRFEEHFGILVEYKIVPQLIMHSKQEVYMDLVRNGGDW